MNNSHNKRIIIMVLDSLGMGALPDAAVFDGEQTGNTLGHIAAKTMMSLPNLQKIGIANIIPLDHILPLVQPMGSWGKMAARSQGKDTTTGHWEMAGLVLERPLPLYPHGFPAEIIEALTAKTGRGILGNKPASGLAIIEELGEEQQKTGKIIVYTSADSVLQIAAHEEVVSLDELYKICTIARELLTGIHGVGRVIARPFLGEAGAYYRTENRKDFSLMPPAGGLLQRAREKSLAVFSVGKIYDIFAGKDISQSIAAHNNRESIEGMKKALSQCQEGLIFVNLVDFDMLYGHRNDSSGYAQALEAVDKSLGEILPLLKDDDLLFITSDHGNDPTTQSTDHNREYALLLAYGKKIKAVDLGVRKSFADLGATAAEYLDLENLSAGESFLQMIIDNN